jgi:hypothetical protein
VVTNGSLSRRAAMSALQAGARERAWMSATPRARARDASRPAFAQICSGSFVCTGSRTSSPPARASSGSSRPPLLATRALWPARVSASAISMVVRSTPPASSVGATCRIVRMFAGTACFQPAGSAGAALTICVNGASAHGRETPVMPATCLGFAFANGQDFTAEG